MTTLDYGHALDAAPSWRINFLSCTSTLDAGALIAQERRDVRVVVLFEIAAERQIEMVLPSVVLAQVWRNGARQVQLARTLTNPGVTEAPLHHEDAKRVGELLRESATADMADAHVAVLAGILKV
jgi:hypothetical protein